MITLKGTSIIEIVIATALISMAIIAALSLTNNSLKQSLYARNLAEATEYATQAADWIRTQRDTLGWGYIYSYPESTYCLNTFPADFTAIQSGTCTSGDYLPQTKFQRSIVLSKPDAETAKFVIAVSWEDKITRVSSIEMELTSWH